MNCLTIQDFSLELMHECGWKHILHHLDFTLEKGETLGIVGESGSGKSVTALSIMRLLSTKIAKTSGQILFNEQKNDLANCSEKELQKIRGNRIAMIFQEPMTSLNPVIKCGEQITETIRLHKKISEKEAKKRTLTLFEEVQLPAPEKIFQSYPHELSGGQKQRVMIAMAISCNPEILIADEPTTALDVTVQKGILELIKHLQQKYGMSVIFITHDLGVVAEVAHHVLVMHKGKIIEQGKVCEIFKNPQEPYTKGLLACRKMPDSQNELLNTIEDFLTEKIEKPNIFTPKIEHCTRSESLIKIENLCKNYPIRKQKLFEKQTFFTALQNINLVINEGETLGLVGESGCGKTTLGRAILRLIEPTSGVVHFQGKNMGSFSASELRKLRTTIQIILQDPYSSLNQRLTIFQMLMEPLQVHNILENDKQRKMRAIELMERVGLSEAHLYRYPHEFSGGQRQRIAIARALTVNPKFIVCDESVSALDVSVQAQVLNLLNGLKRECNLTYLFISHDLSVVKYMSDRIAVMQHGEILELGTPTQIYNAPQTAYTQQLIDAIPKIG